MAKFSTTITIDPADVATLKGQGYSLYAFKAVETTSSGGAPTVWFRLEPDNLATSNVITWEEEYGGFNSRTQIGPRVTVVSSNHIPTDLGNRITIDQVGNLTDDRNGIDRAVTFFNTSTIQYTVGISQVVDGESRILCALPILGRDSVRSITPISKIALIFSTDQVATSTVITTAMSGGAIIDLTGVESRTVSFSANKSWSAEGNPGWLKTFNPLENLTSMLIKAPGNPEAEILKKFRS